MARPKGTNLVQEIVEGQTTMDDFLPKSKKKYAVNVVFDSELEYQIKAAAKARGLGVATYIKLLVNEDLKK